MEQQWGGQVGQSTGAPSAGANEFQVKFNKKLLSSYSELDHLNIKPVFTLYERVVHVGETCNRFADIGCDCELHKMRSVTGLRPDPLGQL